jgi:hypothetical protein
MADVLPFFQGAASDDDATQVMGKAFDRACQSLHDNEQPDLVRQIIAKRIIEVARKGERDLDELCARALQALGFRIRQDLKELALRNGMEIHHASFQDDMNRLIRGVKEEGVCLTDEDTSEFPTKTHAAQSDLKGTDGLWGFLLQANCGAIAIGGGVTGSTIADSNRGPLTREGLLNAPGLLG